LRSEQLKSREPRAWKSAIWYRVLAALAVNLGLATADPVPCRAQEAVLDPSYLMDSVTISFYVNPNYFGHEENNFRLEPTFGMMPRLELRITTYPAPTRSIWLVLQLVHVNGIPGPTLWKGKVKTAEKLILADSIDWATKQAVIDSGRFVARIKVDPPGTPVAQTHEFTVTKN
jgi:hypothetical protein